MSASETTVDISGLNYSIGELSAVLKVDCKSIVRTQAALLAGDIADALGPKTISRGNSSVLRGVKRSFFPIKKNIEPFSGTRAGSGGIRWIFGTKKTIKALVGVDEKDFMPDVSADAMRKLQSKNRGAAWKDLGHFSHHTTDSNGRKRKHFTKFNGVQHAIKIDRVVVSKTAFDEFVRRGKEFVGQLKASFSYASQQLGRPERRQWVSRHFPTRAGGKAIFIDETGNGSVPSITFGSKAKGVKSNPKITAIIQGQINRRSHLMSEAVKKVLQGYTYDFKTGGIFRPRAEKP